MLVRLCKIVLVAAMAACLGLIVFNNLADYGSNLRFVRHVLSMDTLFSGESNRWRAWESPALHHAVYVLIIGWEAAAALLCAGGAVRLWKARRGSDLEFNRAKPLACAGLTIGLLLWFGAFLTVGGEWFLMWQSRAWNGQESAFRLAALTGLLLLFLAQPERETEAV